MAKVMIAILIMLSCLFVSSVFGGTGEVCFPFGSQDPPTNQPQPAQGRPGRIGPVGPPGAIGLPGAPGASGACACDPSEIEQLREEIRIRDEKIEKNTNFLSRVRRTNTDLYCGVGLKDGTVRDEDITASSFYNRRYLPHHARLDKIGTSSLYGGWLARGGCDDPVGQWLQVDLRNATKVVAVVTQGLNYPGGTQHIVKSYKIAFSNNTDAHQFVQNDNGTDLIFFRNVAGGETHATNEFPSPVTARYFRFYPQTFGKCATVRLEYLTC